MHQHQSNANKAGGLTSLGRWVLAISVVMFVLSVVIELWKRSDDERARRTREAETQIQLNEIRRAVYAMNGLHVSFAIVYPIPTDGSSPYQTRIKALGRVWRPNAKSALGGMSGVSGAQSDNKGDRFNTITF